MDLRCDGPRPGRAGRPCRTLLGRVERVGNRWWVEVAEPRRPPEPGLLFTPGRRELPDDLLVGFRQWKEMADPRQPLLDAGRRRREAWELVAWCPRHRRQVLLNTMWLITAAVDGEAELLLSPHPIRLYAF